jgi:hypothetical protein
MAASRVRVLDSCHHRLPWRYAVPEKEGHRRQAAQPAGYHPAARGEYLGIVRAADERSAEAAAVAAFKLDGHRRKQLVVRED